MVTKLLDFTNVPYSFQDAASEMEGEDKRNTPSR